MLTRTIVRARPRHTPPKLEHLRKSHPFIDVGATLYLYGHGQVESSLLPQLARLKR